MSALHTEVCKLLGSSPNGTKPTGLLFTASQVALVVKESACNARDLGWSLDQEDPLEKETATTPVFLPGELHRQRRLVSYSPWGHKESDMTEKLTLSLSNTNWASLVTQMVKNQPAMQETWVWSLGREDPLEKGMVTHSSILAWRIPWTEESGRLESIGSKRVRHYWIKHTLLRNM